MSLKQFPSHGTFSKESDERAAAEKRQQLAARGQQHEDDPYHGHGPRLTAAVFNVEQAWDMLDEKKQHLQVESEDTSGMDQMNRNEAARVAAAAGVKIDNTMTVGQAVQIYSRQKFHEIRFYLFYIAYITSVFILRADNLQSNSVFRTLRNSVAERPFAFRNSTMIFREVSSHEHFWEYLEHGVPEQLFSNVGGYDPGTFELVSHDGSTGMLYVSKYNMMVQPVRIRQLRVAQEQIRESDSCEVNLKMSETVTTCWPVYAPEQESALPWVGQDGSELGFQGADALQTSMHTRGTAFNYGGGGHVIDIPLASTRAQVQTLLANLRRVRWTDSATRAVFIDSAFYNAVGNVFCSVRVVFEFLPYGDVRPTLSIRVFKGPLVTVGDHVLFYLDWFGVFFIFVFLFHDCYKVSQIGPLVHFRSGWSWLNVVLYAFTVPMLVLKATYLTDPAMVALSTEAAGADLPTEVLDLDALGAQYAVIMCVQGFVILCSWLKLIEYTKYVSASMHLLLHSIGACAYECGVWFLMLFVIINAYGQAFYLSFGPDIDGFDDIGEALSTITVWVFGKVDFQKVLSSDQLIASLLFVSFQIVYSVVMANMFIVILIRSYTVIKKANFDDPIAAEIRRKVRRQTSRIRELLLGCMPTLSFASGEEFDEYALREAAEEDLQHAAAGADEGGAGIVELQRMVRLLDLLCTDVRVVSDRAHELFKTQARINDEGLGGIILSSKARKARAAERSHSLHPPSPAGAAPRPPLRAWQHAGVALTRSRRRAVEGSASRAQTAAGRARSPAGSCGAGGGAAVDVSGAQFGRPGSALSASESVSGLTASWMPAGWGMGEDRRSVPSRSRQHRPRAQGRGGALQAWGEEDTPL
jgi:hypothetical protein